MKKLKELSEKAAVLAGVSSLIGWDQETYMPPGSAASRGEQNKLISGMLHDLKTSKEYKSELEKHVDLKSGEIKGAKTEEEIAALREWRLDFLRDTALPTSFVEEFSKATSESTEVWKQARSENNFSLFAPQLQKMVDFSIKKAEYLGYEETPYDALLNLYERGVKSSYVKKLFDATRKPLIEILNHVKIPKVSLNKEMSVDEQLKLSQKMLDSIGYDCRYGRLDISTHPFSSASHPTDSRITTRIHQDQPLSNILTTLHEAGHALYEMNLPQKHFGSPLCEAISTAVHESQSRFWETRIGLSLPFWKWMAPEFNEPAEMLYNAVNQVKPSYIRVEADEVTYPLHVMLRFNLEKDLIEGKLKVKDVPEAWNHEMKELLGITPPTDTLGCLQDVHWSFGLFGYFPTYLLGTMYASHLFEKFVTVHPDWEKKVAAGDFKFIQEWLKTNIHEHGRRYGSLEIIERVTGKPFSSEAFLKYLTKKYTT